MKRIRKGLLIVASLAGALPLAGCFEVTKDATFRDSGEASVAVEIALAPELAAIITNPVLSKQFEKEGAPNFLADCGKPWPADKPLPDGVRSIESVRGKRGDMETCALVIEVPDPVRAVASANEMQPPARHKIPRQDFTLTRLDGRSGYRFRAMLTPLTIPRPPGGDQQDFGRAMLEALFANRHMTLGLTGQKIENTNGELSLDGRRVTWRLSVAEMLDPTRDKPITFEADILYK